MIIAVSANDQQWQELTKDGLITGVERIFLTDNRVQDVGAFLILDQPADLVELETKGRPVLLNSVTNTLAEMKLPANFVRINGWSSFISRTKWEIAGELTKQVTEAMAVLQKQPIPVSDTEGLVAARVVSMIINEAYFALGENISTKAAIDVAMKLGTNYPYGPFEWATIVGLPNILQLLEKLSLSDDRYIPAPLLKKEAAYDPAN